MATSGAQGATVTITLRPTVSFTAVEAEVKLMAAHEREHYMKALKDHTRKMVR